MGSCIGRCACQIGKCSGFCCDCVFAKHNRSSTRPTNGYFVRRGSNLNKSPAFNLRRPSLTNAIEFENLMFEFDLPDLSTSMLQLQPTGASSWMNKSAIKNNKSSGHHIIGTDLAKVVDVQRNAQTLEFANPIFKETRPNELPIIFPLASGFNSIQHESKLDRSPEHRERMSLGGASSMGELNELQWENEIFENNHDGNHDGNHDVNLNNDSMKDVFVRTGIEMNEHERENEIGNELEWDDFDEVAINLHNETDQLISEIEEMTRNSLNQSE